MLNKTTVLQKNMIIQNRSLKYNKVYKKIYYLHKSMRDRCYLKSCGAYSNYGAKGVTVDEKWLDLNTFIETIDKVDGFDLYALMQGKLQLDKDIKMKNNKVYSVENCTFVTASENQGNRPYDVCEFVAVSEKEDIYFLTNREKFCRENNLDSSTVWRMLNKDKLIEKGDKKGIPYFYKGWQFFYQDGFDESKIKRKRVIRATNIDTSDIVDFYSPKEFAEQYNINPSSITACLRGDQKKAGRWEFKIQREGIS